MIFDSSVWIAFLYQLDNQHHKAEEIFEICDGLITVPEYVIIEVVTVLTRKHQKHSADQFLEMVIDNKDVDILYCSDQFFMTLANFFKEQPQDKLSFVDMMLLKLSHTYQIVTLDQALKKAIDSYT